MLRGSDARTRELGGNVTELVWVEIIVEMD